ncbi:acyltransferase [Paenimyroides tangerinum]|uniref:Acyltransferase n=1 Tax=Paenimyroides tangerinum TaxID=2488728 RepID=A0A3P3W538_9FLAO|nr:acyltransferase [Paenimyroides tangerinum]RRJ89558.1 acyltransferase [Paenimyroides tangerinum]
MIKNIINSILKKFNSVSLLKRATILGKVDFLKISSIVLFDGSTKEDIVLGDNCRMYGTLMSQNNGKIIIKENVKIGGATIIGAVNSITIGKGTALADNIRIYDNNNHPVNPEDRKIMYASSWDSDLRNWKHSDSAPIVIGENVWIGQFVRINKGVTIGDNSVIAACSVVTKNVPSNTIVAGNPAKVVKENIDQLPRKFV